MHNKWYSQLLFPTRSRKWIKLIFWLAITDITVYKWILKWVEWMGSRSRSITTCSLIVTRHLLKYSLNNATFDYSKQFERNTKKKKKNRANYHFQSTISIARRTRPPPSSSSIPRIESTSVTFRGTNVESGRSPRWKEQLTVPSNYHNHRCCFIHKATSHKISPTRLIPLPFSSRKGFLGWMVKPSQDTSKKNATPSAAAASYSSSSSRRFARKPARLYVPR